MRPPIGLPKLVLIVLLYPFSTIASPRSSHVAPSSVEISTTPPSKPVSAASGV